MLDQWNNLPLYDIENLKFNQDWLIQPCQIPSNIYRTENVGEIILTNGLITRMFILEPNCATISFEQLDNGQNLIRGIKPEAKVRINDVDYSVGGLIGQKEYAYLLPEWIADFENDPQAFHCDDFSISPMSEHFLWKQVRYASNTQWPPAGIMLTFTYSHSNLPNVLIQIHYELYDGIPVICKWLTISNQSETSIQFNTFTSEILAVVETDSVPQGDPNRDREKAPLHMESDYIFSAMSAKIANKTTIWGPDLQYTSQVAYEGNALTLLESRPPIGPNWKINPGEFFDTFRTYELLFDITDRERRTLAQRRMYRVLAPWTTENPIFMHSRSANPQYVKEVIDQCVEVGFEMVILTFGTGIEMEWEDPEFYEEFRELFDYAHSKGIEIGAYSLFSSRSINPENDVVMPEDSAIQKSPTFGHAPCLGSEWGFNYLRLLRSFIEQTGANFIEHDGPYPGDVCASTSHPGHQGLEDSQWAQWKLQCEFYQWCKANGVFINAPDWYVFNGENKTGMGYKEVDWSLPRERQVILARQNIFDGTWEKTPSMGWMFTPLSVYHMVGDWQHSTLEPLSEHLSFYDAHLRQNFSSGVQSCYRGMKLYDCNETKAVVKQWVDFYKTHRVILDSDIIHIRRPDGRHIDGILHVNSQLPEKGLAVFYNPRKIQLQESIKLNLYYTGLSDNLKVSEKGEHPQVFSLNRDYSMDLIVSLEPESSTWFLFEAAD